MNVTELFRRLSYKELSNLSMSNNGDGTITSAQQSKIIAHANEGLVRLYSRFTLREKELILEMKDGITNYHFLKRFAVSNCDEEFKCDPKYIKDYADPFEEDVLKVLRVVDSCNKDLPLNDSGDCLSVFTPQPLMLQVPHPKDGEMLSVIYRARHVPLEYGVVGAEIVLPVVLEGALTAFIAHGIYASMNGAENATKGQEYLGIFNSICNEITQEDLVNSSQSSTLPKFHQRGFI